MRCALLVTGGAFTGAAVPILLGLQRALVDTVAGTRRLTVSLVLAVVGAALVAGLSRVSRPVLDAELDDIEHRLTYRYRLAFHDALLAADRPWRDDAEYADLSSRALEASQFRAGTPVRYLVDLAASIAGLTGSAAVVLATGIAPALLVAAGAIPLAATAVLSRRASVRASALHERDFRRQIAYAAPLVDSNSATGTRVNGLARPLLELADARMGDRLRAFHAEFLRLLPLGVVSAAAAGGAVVGAVHMLASANATPGSLVVAVGGVAALSSSLVQLGDRIGWLHETLQALGPLFAVIDTPPLLPRRDPPVPLPPGPLSLDVNAMTFTYPRDQQPVLHDLSFSVPAGSLVALVGENGAGKTTLVRLLLRLYGPDRGTISLGGVDLRDADPEAVRSRLAVHLQDSVKYMLTVRDNVAFGRTTREASDDSVLGAVDAGGAQSVVSDLGGLDAWCGRFWVGGHELSGGQWQRLALARHAFRDGDIWVLDEPSSSLDPDAEEALLASLRARLGDRTAFVVSHRLSIARRADLILVMRDGRIVEQGDHTELVANDGHYARLFSEQAATYQ